MPDSIKVEINQNESFLPKKFFNEQWQLYQKVLNKNYMGHHEIYVVLHELLLNYFQKPFTMLDIGCGDASFTSQALLNTQIAEYTGIDLSNPALKGAEKNLAVTKCKTNFIKGDCWELTSELAKNKENKFNVILISFALHHLQIEEKDNLIKQVKKLLIPGGIFILIDIVRKEEESRDNYVKRYLENVEKYWSLLTPQEYSMVENHMSSSDFPETQQTLQTISEKYGFSDFKCVYRDSLDTTQMLSFYQ
ncbi:class I SAM-dependent methyltransferase [Anabaena sp. WFMT]|uniref:class I SAM-dependent methyltransferase n=1 Tax=Anabaena sp. WFMT TaxID=3449730 RepID=UPI003F29F548